MPRPQKNIELQRWIDRLDLYPVKIITEVYDMMILVNAKSQDEASSIASNMYPTAKIEVFTKIRRNILGDNGADLTYIETPDLNALVVLIDRIKKQIR